MSNHWSTRLVGSATWLFLAVFAVGCVPEADCTEKATCPAQMSWGDAEAGDAGVAAGAVGPGAAPGESDSRPQSSDFAGGGSVTIKEFGDPDAGATPVANDEGVQADAGSGAPQGTTIILHNTNSATPSAEGIVVFVNSPEGAEIDIGRSDAEGKVQLQVPAGSTVSALVDSSYTVDGEPRTNKVITSWFGVPAVDPLHLNVTRTSGDVVSSSSPALDVAVELQATRAPADGDTGEIEFVCGERVTVADADSTIRDFNASYTGTGVRPCSGVDQIEVWGFARGGWVYGTVSTDPEDRASVELRADNTLWNSSTLSVAGIPEGAERVEYSVSPVVMQGSRGPHLETFVANPSGEAVLSVQVPSVNVQHVAMSAVFVLQQNPYIGARLSRQRAAVEDLTWNPSQDLALFEAVPSVNHRIAAQPALTWQLADTGNLGDYIVAHLQWRDIQWTAYVPPTRQGTAQVPEFPSGLSRYQPWAADTITVGRVVMTDELQLEGYDRILAQPYNPTRSFNESSIQP